MTNPSPRLGHVLIIAYHFPPEPAAGSVRPSHLAKYLDRLGYQVQVLTAAPQDGATKQPYSVTFIPSTQRKPKRDNPAGITEMVLRKFFFPHDEGVLWNIAAFQQASELVQTELQTTVFTTFPPASTHICGLRLKRRFPSIQWVADFRDPMVNSPGRLLVNARQKFGALATKTDEWLEQQIFDRADLLIANTDTVAERWRARYPAHDAKIRYLWNGFDNEKIFSAPPIPPRPFRLLSHLGAIYHQRNPGIVIDSIYRLISSNKLAAGQVKVELVGFMEEGNLPNQAIVDKLVAAGCLHYTGKMVSDSEFDAAMAASDYLLLLDVSYLDAGQQVPSKLYTYLQLGRPILTVTTRNSPVERIIQGSAVPYIPLYPEYSEEEIDREVLRLFAMPSASVRASDWFWDNFDAKARVNTLAGWIEEKKRHGQAKTV